LVAGRGVAFGVDVADEKRLALVQEVRSRAAAESTAIIKAIRAAIAQEHEVHPYAILLVAPGSVPVTSSGKLARRRTRDLFLKGEPSAIAPWYSDESANARRGDGTSSKIRSD
jgi:acyl-CoA synthetase (AMP-forming)/AMP-acid ligase II